MLWLIIGEASYEIISSNIHHLEDDNIHQLWVTRPGGKSLKVMESEDPEIIYEYKNAIDTAIDAGARTFVLEQ